MDWDGESQQEMGGLYITLGEARTRAKVKTRVNQLDRFIIGAAGFYGECMLVWDLILLLLGSFRGNPPSALAFQRKNPESWSRDQPLWVRSTRSVRGCRQEEDSLQGPGTH